MQLYLVSHLKLAWRPMLIMEIILLSIGFLQNVMDLLVDVLNPFNKLGGFIALRLNMGIFFLCDQKGKCDINGTQWLKSQPHLKGVVLDRAMGSSIIAMLNIGYTLIPCVWMIGVVHAQYMGDHLVDDLCLATSLGVEESGFGELCVQQWLEAQPKCS